jgi:hypothetical protein
MIVHRYADPESGFVIGVPAGWRVETGDPFGGRLLLFGPAAPGDFQPNVNVTSQDLSALTADEYLTALRLQLKEFAGAPRLDVDAPAAEPPGGHVFEWTTRRPPDPLRGRMLSVLAGRRAYCVTATARPEQFDQLRAEFEEVLGSFRVLDRHSPDTN